MIPPLVPPHGRALALRYLCLAGWANAASPAYPIPDAGGYYRVFAIEVTPAESVEVAAVVTGAAAAAGAPVEPWDLIGSYAVVLYGPTEADLAPLDPDAVPYAPDGDPVSIAPMAAPGARRVVAAAEDERRVSAFVGPRV